MAVQFHAGSHYVALRLLSGYLPEEKLKLVHYGSPQYRFEALMNGEVDAAALMEPWITLAEKLGCRPVCEGHYLGAENASDNMDEETFAAINRAVVKAVDMINADKRKYLHYLIDEPRFASVAVKYGSITPGGLPSVQDPVFLQHAIQRRNYRGHLSLDGQMGPPRRGRVQQRPGGQPDSRTRNRGRLNRFRPRRIATKPAGVSLGRLCPIEGRANRLQSRLPHTL